MLKRSFSNIILSHMWLNENRNKCFLTFFAICCLLTQVVAVHAQEKQVSDFKRIKKSMNSLSFLTPYVIIHAIGNGTATVDKAQTDTVGLWVNKQVTSMLQGKYSLMNVPVQWDSGISQMDSLFALLDSSGKILPVIPTPLWLQPTDTDSSRYALIIFMKGNYHQGYEPYYGIRQSMAANTIRIGSSALSGTTMSIIITDKLSNTILYYRTIASRRYDPRIRADINQLTSTILKHIYYR